jgi:cardiolipin synthase
LLAGLMTQDGGRRRAVYVHAKAMLVDDAWATIGSCNLHGNSLGGHAELNASVWDGSVVRALRCELLAEHLGQDTSGLDDRAAMDLYRKVAEANSCQATAHSVGHQGLAVALSANDYGL